MREIPRECRNRGFTIVELMIVVAMMVIVSFLAVRVMSKGRRGEQAPAFARTLLSTVHQARQTTMASGRPTRLTIFPGANGPRLLSEWQNIDGDWVQLDGLEPAPQSLLLCDPINSASVVTPNPVCPATATTVLMFTKNVATCGPNHWFACITTVNGVAPSPIQGGATLFFQSVDGDKKYKLSIMGLTGMPRLADTW